MLYHLPQHFTNPQGGPVSLISEQTDLPAEVVRKVNDEA
jgi:hypothetical protein